MKKIPVYSSISQCLFKYYTGKRLKFEILQYNQVPIFFSKYFQVFSSFSSMSGHPVWPLFYYENCLFIYNAESE